MPWNIERRRACSPALDTPSEVQELERIVRYYAHYSDLWLERSSLAVESSCHAQAANAPSVDSQTTSLSDIEMTGITRNRRLSRTNRGLQAGVTQLLDGGILE